MGIEALLTTPVGANAANQAGAKTADGKAAPSGMGSLGFIDFIIAQVTAAQTQATANAQTALQTQDTKPGDATDIPQMLAATPGVKDDVQDMEQSQVLAGDPQAQIAATLALNQTALVAGVQPGTAAGAAAQTAADGKKASAPDVMKSLLINTDKDRSSILGALRQLLAKLQKLGNDPDGALSALNLTPDQLTQIKSKIESLLAQYASGNTAAAATADAANDSDDAAGATDSRKDDKEDVAIADVLASLVSLLPPSSQPVFIPGTSSFIFAGGGQGNNAGAGAGQDIASRLNNLVNNNAAAGTPATAGGTAADDEEDAAGGGLTDPNPARPDFNQILKGMAAENSTNGIVPGGAAADASNTGTATAAPDLSVLQNLNFDDSGTLLADSDESAQKLLQTLGLQDLGFSATGLGAGAAANLITQAQSAAAAHPAAQLVAITIQQAAIQGVNRDITLQLDPPELGKVEIQMSFNKDKTVKTVITAEHSDTVSMLQRDSHFLERAFQNAGLDADGSSLSFQLASDGYFNNNSGGNNGSGGGNNSAAPAIDETASTQSTMTWYVDPDTGFMRYDIIA